MKEIISDASEDFCIGSILNISQKEKKLFFVYCKRVLDILLHFGDPTGDTGVLKRIDNL